MRIKGYEKTKLTQRKRVRKYGQQVEFHIHDNEFMKPYNVYMAMNNISALDSIISFDYGSGCISDYEFVIYNRYVKMLKRLVFNHYILNKEV